MGTALRWEEELKRAGRGRRTTQGVPTPHKPTPAYTGRYLGERMNRIRRGGGAVAWSGDACVVLARGCKCIGEQDEGDASVPSPHQPTPRPYGCEGASEATA